MATLSASDNGNGTASVTSSGVAGSATWIRITNTTTGALIWSNSYSAGPVTVTDQYAQPGINNYSASYTNGNGGSVVGTVTASTNVSWPGGTINVEISGPYTGCNWSFADDNNLNYTFLGATLLYSINGGAYQQYGGANAYGLTGDIGANLYIGYSTTVSWQVQVTWTWAGHPNAISSPATGPYSTPSPPPPPPAAPNPPTGLVITSDTGSAITLAWTASVGGATGYEVRRSINGGAWSTLVDQGGTGYTDSAVGTTRPVAYQVYAYNSNSSGTTYSTAATVATAGADSCGVLVG